MLKLRKLWCKIFGHKFIFTHYIYLDYVWMTGNRFEQYGCKCCGVVKSVFSPVPIPIMKGDNEN